MNKKKLYIIIFLFLHTRQNWTMEIEKTDDNYPHCKMMVSAEKKSRKKRKLLNQNFEDDDNYDKEIIQPKLLPKDFVQTAMIAAQAPQIKKYKCSRCPNSNNQKKNVAEHILQKHYNKPEVRILVFDDDGHVSKKIKVKDLGKLYSCGRCDKQYRIPNLLNAHIKRKNHEKEPPQLSDAINNATEETEQKNDLKTSQSKKIFCEICQQSVTKKYISKHISTQRHQLGMHARTIQQSIEPIYMLPDSISSLTEMMQLYSSYNNTNMYDTTEIKQQLDSLDTESIEFIKQAELLLEFESDLLPTQTEKPDTNNELERIN